jgi:hypothetical protein
MPSSPAPPGEGYRQRHPLNAVRVAKLSEIMGRRMHPEWVRRVEKRADFVLYYGRLRANPRFLARELASRKLYEEFKARQAALEQAQRSGDWRTVEQLTRWVVDLAFRPHRRRRNPAPQTVIYLNAVPNPEPKPTTEEIDTDVEAEEIEPGDAA